jgi:hypothetical protein
MPGSWNISTFIKSNCVPFSFSQLHFEARGIRLRKCYEQEERPYAKKGKHPVEGGSWWVGWRSASLRATTIIPPQPWVLCIRRGYRSLVFPNSLALLVQLPEPHVLFDRPGYFSCIRSAQMSAPWKHLPHQHIKVFNLYYHLCWQTCTYTLLIFSYALLVLFIICFYTGPNSHEGRDWMLISLGQYLTHVNALKRLAEWIFLRIVPLNRTFWNNGHVLCYALSNIVATSYSWLLRIWYVVSVNKELKCRWSLSLNLNVDIVWHIWEHSFTTISSIIRKTHNYSKRADLIQRRSFLDSDYGIFVSYSTLPVHYDITNLNLNAFPEYMKYMSYIIKQDNLNHIFLKNHLSCFSTSSCWCAYTQSSNIFKKE